MRDQRLGSLGTQVRLADGREGTVVYNSLIGVGIKWGLHNPQPEDFAGTSGNTVNDPPKPSDWPWQPDALLRRPWRGPVVDGMECVGENFEVLRYGLADGGER